MGPRLRAPPAAPDSTLERTLLSAPRSASRGGIGSITRLPHTPRRTADDDADPRPQPADDEHALDRDRRRDRDADAGAAGVAQRDEPGDDRRASARRGMARRPCDAASADRHRQ